MSRIKRFWPSWVHRIYAFLTGYFWLPCPKCGEMFGGHEADKCGHMMITSSSGRLVCPACRKELETKKGELE